MSHDTIIQNFASRKINRRCQAVFWRGHNVFCEDDIIYSYGHHFPMAKFLGQHKGKNLFIKNGDRYSTSTSSHQSSVQSVCNGPTLSRSAISAAGFSFAKLTLEDIVCYRPDFSKFIYRDTKTGRYYEERLYRRSKGWSDGDELPNSGSDFYVGALEGDLVEDEWKPPRQGMFIPHYWRKHDAKERIVSGCWHILGAVVLQRDGNHFLCSLDEGRYFVSQLPVQVKTVEQAFKSLKPKEVLQAEKAGLNVKRQGEWFFVPTGLKNADMAKQFSVTLKGLKELTRKVAWLPVREVPARDRPLEGNYHVVSHFIHDGVTYARGIVHHCWKGYGGKWTATNQHKTVRLGDEWHKVYRNTEVASWSQGGSFD